MFPRNLAVKFWVATWRAIASFFYRNLSGEEMLLRSGDRRLAASKHIVLFLLTLGVILASRPVIGQVVSSFNPRYQVNTKGDLVFVGNTLMTCLDGDKNVAAELSFGTPLPAGSLTCGDPVSANNPRENNSLNNGFFNMVYVDVDGDASTFNSSSAALNIPATGQVLFAGLYWGAYSKNPNKDNVLFKTPSGAAYQKVSATTCPSGAAPSPVGCQLFESAATDLTAFNLGNPYEGFANVTSLLDTNGDGTVTAAEANGNYFVGNVQADNRYNPPTTNRPGDCPPGVNACNRYAGWNMVVAYQDPTQTSVRNIQVYDGFAVLTAGGLSTLNIPISGFRTKPSGPVNGSLGVIVYEGDGGLVEKITSGDTPDPIGSGFTINNQPIFDAKNPINDVFNGTVSNAGIRNPNYQNLLGLDLDIVSIPPGSISNNATGATITFSTNYGKEGYWPGVLTSAIETDIRADLVITKSDSPDPIVLGSGNITYTLTVRNDGPDPAINTVVTDNLPAGVTFVSATPDSSGSGTCTQASGVVTCNLGTLNNGITRTIAVIITPTAIGTLNNVAKVTSDAFDPTPANNQATEPTTVTAAASADLVTVKSGPTGLPTPGQASYTITTTNNGTSPATNVIIRDSIDAKATFVSASDGGTFSGGVVTWPAITLNPSPPQNIATRTVTVNLPANGSYTNTAFNTSDTPDANPNNNNGSQPDASVTTVVPATADLVTTKSGPTGLPAPGQASYTIVTKNNGPSAATNVVIRDSIATGATFVSASDSGTAAGNTVTWPAITLNSAQSVTRTVTVNLPANGSYTNTSSNTSDTPDSNPSNNNGTQPNASVTTTVPGVATADVTVTNTGTPTITAGNNVTYTLVIRNSGNADAANVVVNDPTPPGLTFVSNSGGCATAFPCNLGSISPNQTRTITVTFNVPANYSGPSQFTTTATVGADNDSNPNNNTDPTPTTVTAIATPPRLRLVKRITNVLRNGATLGGINFGGFVSVDAANDTAVGWPANFLLGVTSNPVAIPVQSDDEVEYSIYYLSDGGSSVNNVKFCDPLATQTTFSPNGYASGSGISLNRAGTISALTNVVDGDAGAFFNPLAPLPAGNGCSSQNNTDGSVTVNLGTIPSTSRNNYGYVRFRVKVK